MKKILLGVILGMLATMVGYGFLYLFFSFIIWDFDIGKWSGIARFLFSCCSILPIGCGISVFMDINDK